MPVLKHELSSLTTLLKANNKAEKGLPSSGFRSNCAAVIQGWPGGQPGQLLEVKLRSCRRGIKLNKSTCLAERSRRETGGRFPYRKPKRKQWIQKNEELDCLGQRERKTCCQPVNYKLFSVYAEESEDDRGVPKLTLSL